ncbi:probable polyamine transporter At3g19553 [Lactuca sativa]|uniref:probable polyamine transporter At3g19553 n=1 Tax=Lactuca sativa TaxID=4236 RepID=UPI000CD8BE0E|nr:probable polyamine transporter At3g19553 [Lactuca sativa]
MGVEANKQTILSNDQKNTTYKKSNPKLTLLPRIALIFYKVSGGPFGVEDSVKSGGGALLSLLGFLIFPIFWSIPEALITAELATSFPENGSYVIWILSTFDPFWGFQEGFWKWFSGVMDNTLYPVLFLDYLKQSLPIFDQLYARIPTFLAIYTILLTHLNYRGLHIVGFSAVLLGSCSLLPFAVMVFLRQHEVEFLTRGSNTPLVPPLEDPESTLHKKNNKKSPLQELKSTFSRKSGKKTKESSSALKSKFEVFDQIPNPHVFEYESET